MRLETRLHRARVARGIDLTELTTRTRLSQHVLQKIDEGRFAELPPGVYARSYVRAFASAVGLEPTEVVQELADVLPIVQDPLDGLRDAARQSASARMPLQPGAARAVAAIFDAAVLLTMNAVLVGLIALTCDVNIPALLDQAGAAVSSFCAIPMTLYFVVFGGMGGRTPGGWLCRVPASPWIVVRGSWFVIRASNPTRSAPRITPAFARMNSAARPHRPAFAERYVSQRSATGEVSPQIAHVRASGGGSLSLDTFATSEGGNYEPRITAMNNSPRSSALRAPTP